MEAAKAQNWAVEPQGKKIIKINPRIYYYLIFLQKTSETFSVTEKLFAVLYYYVCSLLFKNT
jgi:hypothetical protein